MDRAPSGPQHFRQISCVRDLADDDLVPAPDAIGGVSSFARGHGSDIVWLTVDRWILPGLLGLASIRLFATRGGVSGRGSLDRRRLVRLLPRATHGRSANPGRIQFRWPLTRVPPGTASSGPHLVPGARPIGRTVGDSETLMRTRYPSLRRRNRGSSRPLRTIPVTCAAQPSGHVLTQAPVGPGRLVALAGCAAVSDGPVGRVVRHVRVYDMTLLHPGPYLEHERPVEWGAR